MSSILLHICCANCACFPYQFLTGEGFDVTGFWYNPNIHPYTEYQKRLNAVEFFADRLGIKLICDSGYSVREFINNLGGEFTSPERCRVCWTLRLRRTAEVARKQGFPLFSTTLLYSIHQDQQLIKEIGEKVAAEQNLGFYYVDFRKGWQKGIEISKEMGLYRQNYCGCIFSEEERHLPKQAPYKKRNEF